MEIGQKQSQYHQYILYYHRSTFFNACNCCHLLLVIFNRSTNRDLADALDLIGVVKNIICNYFLLILLNNFL